MVDYIVTVTISTVCYCLTFISNDGEPNLPYWDGFHNQDFTPSLNPYID